MSALTGPSHVLSVHAARANCSNCKIQLKTPRCAGRASFRGVVRPQSQRSTGLVARAASVEAAVLSPLLPLDDAYEGAHAFAPYANWIVPGSVMLGRYPYVEPSRCRSYDVGEAQLTALLEAGITTFVCLQAEIPEQESMRLAGVNGFMPYKSTAELIKHAMAGPPPMDVVNGLRTPELDRFLPPRHKPANEAYVAYTAREELNFCHCPIEDLGVPGDRQLEELVQDLQERVAQGEVLYVHCWGGRGRAGLVGASYLAAAYGISADEALERVQRAFDTRRDNERRSPETDQQHALVRAYAASHAERQAGRVHKV